MTRDAGKGGLVGERTDQVVVRLVAGVEPAEALAALGTLGVAWGLRGVEPMLARQPRDTQLAEAAGLSRFAVVSCPIGTDTRALAGHLSERADLFEFAFVEPVGALDTASPPADALFPFQWALNNIGQTLAGGIVCVPDADIDWIEADVDGLALSPVTVAVLDTGVSASHPDLLGKLVPGRCFTCSTNPDYTDDSTSNSHGTACSGIIAAIANNGIGISGAAPNALIMPCRMVSGILVTQTAAANAVIWAADNGAKILNMSWSFSYDTSVPALQSAIAYAHSRGVLLVASSGNSPGTPIGFPAQWPEVICVGATSVNDQIADLSQWGPEVDIAAPGEYIYTTLDQTGFINGYGMVDGTSFACPQVVAAAAIAWGLNPALTSAEVRALLERNADDLGTPGPDQFFGAGRLNMQRVVTAARAILPTCDADVDGNGSVTVDDLISFLSWYFALDPRSDIDGAPGNTPADLFAYITLWFRGC